MTAPPTDRLPARKAGWQAICVGGGHGRSSWGLTMGAGRTPS